MAICWRTTGKTLVLTLKTSAATLTICCATLSGIEAYAKDAETVALHAEKVTVRIEGATQGSGVIVEGDGSGYTVLTAWHVLKANKQGEQVDIITFDGKSHKGEIASLQKIGRVDLATIRFKATNSYLEASTGSSESARTGGTLYVSGYPLPTTSVPRRILRFTEGQVIANTNEEIPEGYQILYTNSTFPGMSGGPVFNERAKLIGIHGRAETDARLNSEVGFAVKTGTNQGIPIEYFKRLATKEKTEEKGWLGNTFNWIKNMTTGGQDSTSGERSPSNQNEEEVSALLAKGYSLLREKGPGRAGANHFYIVDYNGHEREVIEMANKIIKLQPENAQGYLLRGEARKGLRSGACEELGKRRGYVQWSEWEACKEFEEPQKSFREKQIDLALDDLKTAEVLMRNDLTPLIKQLNILGDDWSGTKKWRKERVIERGLQIDPKNIQFADARADFSETCKDKLYALYLGSNRMGWRLAPLRDGNESCKREAIRHLSDSQIRGGLSKVNRLINANISIFKKFSSDKDLYPARAFKDELTYRCSSYTTIEGTNECINLRKGSEEYLAGLAYRRFIELLITRGTMKIYAGKTMEGCLDYEKAYEPEVKHGYYQKYILGFWTDWSVCKPPNRLKGSNLIFTR